MDIKLHKTATTTPRIRREIQQAPASISDSELAPRYRVSCPTIARWRYRETQHDLPHTRHNLLTTLSPAQEEIVVALREYLRLSVDDLLVVAREFLHPDLSRSALQRLLKRRGLPSLAALKKQEKADQAPTHKPFKAYTPGYIHVDVKHLLKCPTRTASVTFSWLSIALPAGSILRYVNISPHKMPTFFYAMSISVRPSRSRRCSPITARHLLIALLPAVNGSPVTSIKSISSVASMALIIG